MSARQRRDPRTATNNLVVAGRCADNSAALGIRALRGKVGNGSKKKTKKTAGTEAARIHTANRCGCMAPLRAISACSSFPGDTAPGHVLDGEVEASEQRKVSRTAYREALRILAAKGLVDSRPRVGTRVSRAGTVASARSGRVVLGFFG